jgi:hypothetical protein
MAEYPFTLPMTGPGQATVEDPRLCELLGLDSDNAPYKLDADTVYVTSNEATYRELLSEGCISHSDAETRADPYDDTNPQINRLEREISASFVPVWFNEEQFGLDFVQRNPVYYDEAGRWYAWNKKGLSYQRIDETNLFLMIDASLRFIRNKMQDDYDAAKDDGRKALAGHLKTALKDSDTNVPSSRNKILFAVQKEARSHYYRLQEPEWFELQLGDQLINLETGAITRVHSGLLVKNPIPWRMIEGPTPKIDKLFSQWAPDDQRLLMEVTALSMVPRYFVKRVFWLLGGGDNGKSTYLKFLSRFVGQYNVTSSDLYQLENNRFETSGLVDKLVCVINEVDHKTLWQSRILKAISGRDMIRIEEKNKQSLKEELYSKIIIAANHLPRRSDFSDANIGRFVGITFPNKFEPGPDPVDEIRAEEYRAFAYRCVYEVLRPSEGHEGLIFTKKLRDEMPIDAKSRQYDELSDSLQVFIKDHIIELDDDEHMIPRSDFYKAYLSWCKKRKLNYETQRKTYSRLRLEFDWQEGKPRMASAGGKQKRVYYGVKWKEEESLSERVFIYIKSREFVSTTDLVSEFGTQVHETLNRMLAAGDLFESKPGELRCT